MLDLDHVAVATADATPVLEGLVEDAGATILYGAADRGMRWVLVHAGDEDGGMLVEVLEPWLVEEDPFAARFLERRGEGAHHLTFKTGDIRGTIEAFERAGLEPIDQRLENPVWREAFIRPRDAHGTIVQLVETTIKRPPLRELLTVAHGPDPAALDHLAGGAGSQVAEHWWAEPGPRAAPVVLRCVAFGAEDPEAAAGFYERLLGGTRVPADGAERIELAWPSGGRLGFEPAGERGSGIVAFEFEAAPAEPFWFGRTAITFGP